MSWRAQVVLMIVPVVALAVVIVLLLPSGKVASIPAPSLASETQCLPITQPKTVPELNRMTDTLRGNAEFQGATSGPACCSPTPVAVGLR